MHVYLTQVEMAAALGMGESTLQMYEYGKMPQLLQLFAFLRSAVNAGRLDLAEIFRAEIYSQIGPGISIVVLRTRVKQ